MPESSDPDAVAVITGGNTGLGLETAVALAEQGLTVAITSRDPQRGQGAAETIRERTGRSVDLLSLDLGSFSSIRACAATVLDRYDRLDVLVNNAGVAPAGHRWETSDGFEAAFGINHVGHVLLTQLLTDRLVASAPARIVIVASGAYRFAPDGICFHDLQHVEDFHSMKVYGESKLANLAYAAALAERLVDTGVTVNAVSPGYVATGLGAIRAEDEAKAVSVAQADASARSVRAELPDPMTAEQGAKPSVRAATSPDLAAVTGMLVGQDGVSELPGVATADSLPERLWRETERLIQNGGPTE